MYWQDRVYHGVARRRPEHVPAGPLLPGGLLPGDLRDPHGGAVHHLLPPRDRSLDQPQQGEQPGTKQQQQD